MKKLFSLIGIIISVVTQAMGQGKAQYEDIIRARQDVLEIVRQHNEVHPGCELTQVITEEIITTTRITFGRMKPEFNALMGVNDKGKGIITVNAEKRFTRRKAASLLIHEFYHIAGYMLGDMIEYDKPLGFVNGHAIHSSVELTAYVDTHLKGELHGL